MLNLHATVRGAIQSVNPDVAAIYLKSLGNTPNAAGQQTPSYAPPIFVQLQAQPPSGRDLRHMEFLNIQGATRVGYLYSNPSGIGRVTARGGDLLQFSSFVGAPPENWLVTRVDERWNVGTNNIDSADLPASPPTSGWTKLWLTLQTDPPTDFVYDSSGQFVEDSEGRPVLSSKSKYLTDKAGNFITDSKGAVLVTS